MGKQHIDSLVEWFWSSGHQRTGRFALGTSTWLDDLYRLQAAAETIESAASKNRPSVALWGPSQAGKSTLLSRYFDRSLDVYQSALQWHPDAPVIFVGRKDTPEGCIQLNPHNMGKDASGCVSRFVLSSAVDDPHHPIQLHLASEFQILHSLAAGYLSECDLAAGRSQEVFFGPDTFEELLNRFAEAPRGHTSRIAYTRLRGVADVLEGLIDADWPRYRNLRSVWNSFRKRLLTHQGLLGSPDLVYDFAARLFWDGERNLTTLFDAIRQLKSQIQQLYGNKQIFCSPTVAKVFLNISSYKDAVASIRERHNLDLRVTVESTRVVLNYDAPQRLLTDPNDFGLWQALAWELVFPVNEQVIAGTAPEAHAFFKVADLVDFPGVALQQAGTGVRQAASSMNRETLVTEVLKRGKTASFVAHHSRGMGISSFCLLMKAAEPVPQPDQLFGGIKSWVTYFGLPFPPVGPNRPPLNVVLTAFSKAVNADIFALQNSRTLNNPENIFQGHDRLGDLLKPGWPTFFAITSPIWHRFEPCSKEHLDLIQDRIIKDENVIKRFGSDSSALKAVFAGGQTEDGDGGVTYLLQTLTAQAQGSRIPQLLCERERENAQLVRTLFDEALPLDNAEQRKTELSNWKNAILQGIKKQREKSPEADAAMRISFLLRNLLDVDPNVLESIPLQCSSSDMTEYVARQFNACWLQSRHQLSHDFSTVGLTDQTLTERLLGYLSEYAIKNGSATIWVRQNLGQINNQTEADYARRFLALKMSDALCFGLSGRKRHRQFASSNVDENIEGRLADYVAGERLEGAARKDDDSPHFKGFINPFLAHLDAIAESTAAERPALIGDDQLRNLRLQFNFLTL